MASGLLLLALTKDKIEISIYLHVCRKKMKKKSSKYQCTFFSLNIKLCYQEIKVFTPRFATQSNTFFIFCIIV